MQGMGLSGGTTGGWAGVTLVSALLYPRPALTCCLACSFFRTGRLIVAVKLDTTTGGSPALWALQLEKVMKLGLVYLWLSAPVLGERSSGLWSKPACSLAVV